MDRLRLFLGKKPIPITEKIHLHSPTVTEIDNIGEITYNIYIHLSTFNKEIVLKSLFQVDDKTYELVENENDYDVLTDTPILTRHISEALSFFCKSEVTFDNNKMAFLSDGEIFVNKENYMDISSMIKEINGMSFEDKNKLKFKNDRAKKMHEKLEKLKAKYKKNDDNGLELKDILSILCNKEGNGINIFNVEKLTIYQVYEQFERLNIKENHSRTLKVWANGLLKENDKLPEWIVKTKL